MLSTRNDKELKESIASVSENTDCAAGYTSKLSAVEGILVGDAEEELTVHGH